MDIDPAPAEVLRKGLEFLIIGIPSACRDIRGPPVRQKFCRGSPAVKARAGHPAPVRPARLTTHH